HNAENWRGEIWDYTKYDKADKIGTSGAHPNSRFTAKATNCPCLSSEFNNPKGVPVSAIIFGGRRARTAPLVYQSTSWQNGTFVGSIMASETTAAAAGAIGVVRRDPMAMRPFVGYNMGDYWAHWLEMGTKIPHAPKIFHVNWFRTDENGNFIWPGFGENLRVVLWILARCAGEVDADITPIGYVPKAEDINIEGLDGVTLDTIRELLSIDTESWLADVQNIKEFYNLVGDRVPDALWDELAALEARLSK
nr:phosphoenolpyruvate carboxykinase (GTP) [Clostridiales bacterium]